jgi:IS30 family transposase
MRHLQVTDRLQIETLLRAGHTQSFIAKQLNRSGSVISTEIKRNTVDGNYCHNKAQKLAEQRRSNSKSRQLTNDNWMVVKSLLKLKWSPEQISGWLKTHPEAYDFSVSDQWIYEYINNDRANGGDLYQHLRRAGKPYKFGGKKVYRGKIKDRVDISLRPEIIDKRLRIGDWEVDSVIGKLNQSSIVTIVERVSRYTAIIKVTSKESDTVCEAIINRMSNDVLPIYSMTGDNGTEFSEHKKIAEALGIDFYFTHPYSSWEKGANENMNGLIRQYFPKGTDFAMITESMLQEVEDALNGRPRKTLNYKTPREVMGIGAK